MSLYMPTFTSSGQSQKLHLVNCFIDLSFRVNCCLFAPAGWLLVTGSSAGDLMLFNIYSTKLLKSQLGTHDMGVTALALDPTSTCGERGAVGGAFDQFKMASAGNDSLVRLWTVRCNGNVPNSSECVYGREWVYVCECVYGREWVYVSEWALCTRGFCGRYRVGVKCEWVYVSEWALCTRGLSGCY